MHRVHVGDQDNCKLWQLVLLQQIQVHLCQQFAGVNGIAYLNGILERSLTFLKALENTE